MEMKVTVNPEVNGDLDYWEGKKIICRIIITDIDGQKYESEIHLPKNWKQKLFSEALCKSFLMCENTPKETYIEYMGPDLEIMN